MYLANTPVIFNSAQAIEYNWLRTYKNTREGIQISYEYKAAALILLWRGFVEL